MCSRVRLYSDILNTVEAHYEPSPNPGWQLRVAASWGGTSLAQDEVIQLFIAATNDGYGELVPLQVGDVSCATGLLPAGVALGRLLIPPPLVSPGVGLI